MSTTNSAQRKLDQTAVAQILSSRRTFGPLDAGKTQIVDIQRDATLMTAAQQAGWDKEAGRPAAKSYFDKHVYNLKATDSTLVQKHINLFKEGVQLESAGDIEGASEKYNEFLNACQVTYNEIVNATDPEPRFRAGDEIKVKLAMVASEQGNSSKIGTVGKATLVAPENVAPVKYDVSNLLALAGE